jgi:hypothetical protein
LATGNGRKPKQAAAPPRSPVVIPRAPPDKKEEAVFRPD